jgi:hypothetical protein
MNTSYRDFLTQEIYVLTLSNQNVGEALGSPDNDIVTSKTIVDDVRVGIETVYKCVDKGIIPVFRINARYHRFSRREVRQDVARYRIKEEEEAP